MNANRLSLNQLLSISEEMELDCIEKWSYEHRPIRQECDRVLEEFPALKRFLDYVESRSGICVKYHLWIRMQIAIDIDREDGRSSTIEALSNLPEDFPRIDPPRCPARSSICAYYTTYYIVILNELVSKVRV